MTAKAKERIVALQPNKKKQKKNKKKDSLVIASKRDR